MNIKQTFRMKINNNFEFQNYCMAKQVVIVRMNVPYSLSMPMKIAMKLVLCEPFQAEKQNKKLNDYTTQKIMN